MNVATRALVTSLVLAAVAVASAVLAAGSRHPAPGGERRADAVSRGALAPPPRTAREILDRGAELSLRPVQVARLEALDREWRSQPGRLEADLDAAMAEFSLFMGEAQTGRGTTLAEIQRRSAEIATLGRALREEVRLHGEAVARLLTDGQRERLGQMAPPAARGGRK